jgi:hypothetical protein
MKKARGMGSRLKKFVPGRRGGASPVGRADSMAQDTPFENAAPGPE